MASLFAPKRVEVTTAEHSISSFNKIIKGIICYLDTRPMIKGLVVHSNRDLECNL